MGIVLYLKAFGLLSIVTSFDLEDCISIRVRASNFPFAIAFKMDTASSVARCLGLDGGVVNLTARIHVLLM
jgi:hypothetical protein